MKGSQMSPSPPELRTSVLDGVTEDLSCDVAIVGSGMGGATLAYAIRETGARVLVLEQGDFLPREKANWDMRQVHMEGIYKNSAPWRDRNGEQFIPSNYHYVGGNSKVFGATALRLRESDFGDIEHREGVSPAWPLTYADLEAHYGEAERIFWVHGEAGSDPTDPWRSSAYPHPPVRHEPVIEELANRLRTQGLHPFPLPLMLDLRQGGKCIRCNTCDGFPCMLDAKGDADVCAMRPALESDDVQLMVNAEVLRLDTDGDGRRVTTATVRHHGRILTVTAGKFVLAAGAINTAALLLRSRSDTHPRGLSNGSDQVGRNYMNHTTSFFVAIDPRRRNDTIFQKTMGLNDWYEAGTDTTYPLGNVQGLGKLRGPMVKSARKVVPVDVLDFVTRRSVDLFVQSEALPTSANRIRLNAGDQIVMEHEVTNMSSHNDLIEKLRASIRVAGYPIVRTQLLGANPTGHQCGTGRMGEHPESSVVDAHGRSHEVSNLWLCDASVFPSSGAVNPALTIAALALRLGASDELELR